jgi:hypothetical protein
MSDESTDQDLHHTTDATIVAADIAHCGRPGAPPGEPRRHQRGGKSVARSRCTASRRSSGRSTLANTYVASPSVSRQHARIDLVAENGDKDQFMVSDMGSSNGTFVNSERVKRLPLNDGDKVRMGDVVFKFIVQDEVEAQFHKEVHQLIHYDQLTGLLKMEAFRRRLDTMLARTAPCPAFHALHDRSRRTQARQRHATATSPGAPWFVRDMGEMMRGAMREEDCIGALRRRRGHQSSTSDATLEIAREVAEGLRKTIEARQFEHDGKDLRRHHFAGPRRVPAPRQTPPRASSPRRTARSTPPSSSGRNCVVTADEL